MWSSQTHNGDAGADRTDSDSKSLSNFPASPARVVGDRGPSSGFCDSVWAGRRDRAPVQSGLGQLGAAGERRRGAGCEAGGVASGGVRWGLGGVQCAACRRRRRWAGLVSRRAVSELEASVVGAELPSAMAQRSVLDPTHLGVPQLAVTAVYLSFFVVPHVVAAVLLVRNRYLFRKAVVALALLFGAGVVAFAVAPTDPPWLAASKDQSLGDVQRLTRYVLGELGVQFGYATDGEQGYGFEPNPLASMPSIHLGVTVLIGAIAWQSRSYWRWVACAYAVAMGIALVASGEHYLLDVLAGALLAMAAWALAGWVLERNSSVPVLGARGRPEPRRGPSARLSTDQSFGRGTEPRSARPRATGAGDPAGRGV